MSRITLQIDLFMWTGCLASKWIRQG